MHGRRTSCSRRPARCCKAGSRTNAGRSPYRLYALSNAGSLAALVTYPFVFEPALRLGPQAGTWSACYGVFAVLCGACAVRVYRSAAPVARSGAATDASRRRHAAEPPRPGASAVWLALAACGSVVLLATTSLMCQEVAVVPFLWVLPRDLYLLTFIVAFDNQRWYIRGVMMAALVLVAAAIFALRYKWIDAPLSVEVGLYLLAMLIGCMVCHWLA